MVNVWEKLHHFASGSSSPCTAIASRGEGIFVSVGEDGCMKIVSLESGGPDSIATIGLNQYINYIHCR